MEIDAHEEGGSGGGPTLQRGPGAQGGTDSRGGSGSREGPSTRASRGRGRGLGPRGARGDRAGRSAGGRVLAETINEQPMNESPSRSLHNVEDDIRPSEEAGPSNLWDDLAHVRKRRVEDQRRVNQLQPEVRRQFAETRARKERGLFLMPDAPPKRTRKESPERGECPLRAGVPREPPARIPQPWELVNSTDRPVQPPSPTPPQPLPSPTPSPSRRRHYPIFCPSTGIRSVSCEEAQSLALMPADVEFVECTPESSAFNSPEPSPSLSLYTLADPGSLLIIEDGDDVDSWGQRRTEGSDVDEDITPQERVLFGAEMDPALVLELDAAEDEAVRDIGRAQDYDDDLTTFDWREDVSTFTGSREQFDGPSGPTFPVDGETPLSILEKIWDVELMSILVRETNKYANILYREKNRCRMTRWHDTSIEEMWTFFAVLMIQSLAPLPVESEFWHPQLDILHMPKLAKVMTFGRFVLIKKCLQFVDNEKIVGICNEEKKLAKIKPLIDFLRGKFRSIYMPAQEIALDESLLMWKGRLSFAQLIATKRAKVGIKSYELCESKTGYLWDFKIYTGKESSHGEPESEARNEPQSTTAKIVFDLVRPLLGRGHVLVMDNFYNAPLLSRLLKIQKTDTMGTLRLNREFIPNSLKITKSQMRPGEVAFSQTNDMTILVWRDANLVSMISTFHKVEVGGREKFGRYFYKPQVVLDYNRSMGGVDKKDQLLSAFPMERTRNQIWYKKLFRRMLNISIMNAWIIFCTHNNMTARKYRQNLVQEILVKYKVGWAPGGSVKIVAQNPVKRLLEGGHYPNKAESRALRCKWCSTHGRSSRTSYVCDVCDTALCVHPCFKEYHTQRE